MNIDHMLLEDKSKKDCSQPTNIIELEVAISKGLNDVSEQRVKPVEAVFEKLKSKLNK